MGGIGGFSWDEIKRRSREQREGGQGGGGAFDITGKRKKDLKSFGQDASKRLSGARKRSNQYGSYLLRALENPTGSADAFKGFFEDAAYGAIDPAMRDFNKVISGVQANTAGRFGGNVSSEETRMVRNTSDDFTRNVGEALARIGPQAVAAGQQQNQFTLGARNLMGQEEQNYAAMLLQAILGEKEGGNSWAKLLGTTAGIGMSFIPGGQVPGAALTSASQNF